MRKEIQCFCECVVQTSGLSRFVGHQLESLKALPGCTMVLLIVSVIALLTEVTSNTAVVTLVCPLLVSMVCVTPV